MQWNLGPHGPQPARRRTLDSPGRKCREGSGGGGAGEDRRDSLSSATKLAPGCRGSEQDRKWLTQQCGAEERGGSLPTDPRDL